MFSKFLPSLLTAILLLVPQGASTQDSPAPAQTHLERTDSQLVVPADTTIPLRLENTISSRTAYVGQAIYCQTIYPITAGNRIVIPVGSYVKGAVTQVVRPGRVKGKAKIGLRFDTLTLPSGTTLPLRATLSAYGGNGEQGFSREESRIEGESSKGQDAEKVATTATQGTIIGGLSSRSGKGAGIGALSGGAAGLIWVLASRGKEVLLGPGTNLELQLTAPLRLERGEVDPASPYREGPKLPRREYGPGF